MGGTGCWDLFPASITFCPPFPLAQPLFSLTRGGLATARAAHLGGEGGRGGGRGKRCFEGIVAFFFKPNA